MVALADLENSDAASLPKKQVTTTCAPTGAIGADPTFSPRT